MCKEIEPSFGASFRIIDLDCLVVARRQILAIRRKTDTTDEAEHVREIVSPGIPVIEVAEEITNLSWSRVWTKLMSSTRLTLGLNAANQSLPSFFHSGGNAYGSKSSRNGEGALPLGPATKIQRISNRERGSF